jgi:pyruvate formate lyase activating enzyme
MSENVIGPEVRLDVLMAEIERDRVFYDQSGGGISVSGGEPMMQPDFLENLLRACRGRGISCVIDTSAYAPWNEFERILDMVDLFMVDLKLLDRRKHEIYTGVSNELILDNFDRLVSCASGVRARLPMIPGITDTEENIDSLISFLGRYDRLELISLLPYNRLGEDKFRRLGIEYSPGTLQTQTPDEMCRIAERFTDAGLDVRIGG